MAALQTGLSADKCREATNQAREIAVADAAGTAEILAQAAAVTLGAIKSLSDNVARASADGSGSGSAVQLQAAMAAGAFDVESNGGWDGGAQPEEGGEEGSAVVQLARHKEAPTQQIAIDDGKVTPTPVQLGTTDVSPRLPASTRPSASEAAGVAAADNAMPTPTNLQLGTTEVRQAACGSPS